MISLLCSHCGSSFEVADELQGTTEVCSHCGKIVNIPRPDTAEGSPVFASITGSTPLAEGSSRSKELWSNYGRDALFLASVSLLLLLFTFLVPLLGSLLAGGAAVAAFVMAIRAIILTREKSTKGLAFAIVALVLSLVPMSLCLLTLLALLTSMLR